MKNEKPKVLIVDDQPALLELLQSFFQSRGCETRVAMNGLQALEIISNESITMVISDIRMPVMDGMSLLATLDQRGLDIPVIIMTGHSDYTAEDVDQKGGVVFLEKPVSIEDLREIVEKYLVLLPVGYSSDSDAA